MIWKVSKGSGPAINCYIILHNVKWFVFVNGFGKPLHLALNKLAGAV